jgi:putative membrane protein
MLRRSFLLSLAALGMSAAGVQARNGGSRDFRTADLMTGGFAMKSSQVALVQTENPDVINFANAEIAEQIDVAAALGAVPGSAPLRGDHSILLTQLQQVRGGAFDRAYVQGQLRGHRELLTLNDTALRAGNAQEQQVAQMSLPLIQRHLAILNSLRALA